MLQRFFWDLPQQKTTIIIESEKELLSILIQNK